MALAAGAAPPPLALDDEEAVALAVGLQAATASAVAGMAEPSLRALTKVVQVMPTRLRRRMDALRAMTVSAQWDSADAGVDAIVLVTAAQACRDSEGLTMSYTSAVTRSERSIEPHRLVSLGRRWYLVAYDLGRHDWRSFRVDRIEQITSNGRRFRPRDLPADDAAEFVRRGIREAPMTHDVVAVVHAPAEDVRHRVGRWATVEDISAESCRLRMSTDSLDWAALSFGAVAADITDVSPPELVELLRQWADRFQRTVEQIVALSRESDR